MFSLADADGHEAEACEDRFMVMPRTPRGKKGKHDDEVRIMTQKQLNDMCFTTSTLALEMRVGLTTLRSDRQTSKSRDLGEIPPDWSCLAL
jgi:hypothetical protein